MGTAAPLPPAPRRRWPWIALAPVVLVAFGVMAVVSASRLVSVTKHGGNDVSLNLPGGSLRIRTGHGVNPVPGEVPRYPGAVRENGGGSIAVSWDSDDGAEQKDLAASGTEFSTGDAIDRVVSFYREQLPNWMVVTQENGGVHFELRDGGARRLVAITRRNDRTRIAVATIGEPESN